MCNPDDVRRAQAGRDAWNAWALGHQRNGTTYDVDFSGETITTTNFEGFIFPGRANFVAAQFSSEVTFKGARFSRDACFNGAQFLQRATFTEARFFGNAFFSGAKFCDRVCLDRLVFARDANFDKAQFHQYAYLVHTQFHSYANFESSEFDHCLDLTHSHFKGETVFDGVSFKDDALFTGLNVTHHLIRFRKACFCKVPDFRASKFAVPPNMEGMNVEYVNFTRAPIWHLWAGRALGGEDAARFRRLKELAGDARNHERELDFFAKELRAKRFYETRGFGPILLSMAYEILSDFGKSVERPIFWLSLLVIVAAAIILLNYAPAGSPTAGGILTFLPTMLFLRCVGRTFFWLADLIVLVAAIALLACSPTALLASLSNSFPFLGGINWSTDCGALMALSGECEAPAFTILFAGVQSGLSLLLLFLIGLGLRNRFRIGGN